MGVKLNVAPKKTETLSIKPTFENTEDNTPVAPVASTAKAKPKNIEIPACFNMDTPTPATEGWQSMETAPTDRPIMVIGFLTALPEKYSYWEVCRFNPPGYETEGWYVTGTQWHRLYEEFPKAWRETVGHP